MKKLAFTLAFILAGILHAEAAPRLIDRFADWGVYSYTSRNKTICYILTKPVKAEPADVDHGTNFFLIAPNAAGSKTSYEPQASMGYVLKQHSIVNLQIRDKHFRMFTQDKTAWVKTLAREPELMKEIKGGRQMVLQATSARGTHTSYTYSLDGVTAALKRAGRCK